MGETLPETLPARLSDFLDRIGRAALAVGRKPPRRGHGDSYMCCCPAHDDRNPSLSVRLEGERILLHCFAGCSTEDVLAAVGYPLEALFADYRGQPRLVPRIRWNGSGAKASAAAADDRPWTEEAALPAPPPISEFLALTFPPIEPLLGPIATQQLAILYAGPGVGKTMFALALADAIANGRDFIGWTAVREACVLVVDGEMAGEMMQQRLELAANDNLHIANLPNWAASSGYGPVNLCEQSGAETVDRWAAAVGAEVIVLDNLMSLAWMDGVSMNSDEFWQPVRRFAVWQRSLGRTVLIVDHSNKSGTLHGTGTKLWHADLAMELRGLDPEEPSFSNPLPGVRFLLRFSKVRGTPLDVGQDTSEKVVFVGKVGQDWEHESGREDKRRRAQEMAENGLSIRDIADELGAARSTVGRWVKGSKK